MKGMGDLVRQAQMMQNKISKLQEEVGQRTVEAAAGGGMVTVTANGAQEILAVKIDPAVINPDDVDMLQDLVLAAVNEALKKAGDMMKEEMAQVTGGIKIPGMF
ncbi:MAG: YbaB/EbfC family nucleoid-associated protein [Desulfovibrionales bacterium]|uniref:YbaB/EbfC family nucleoid-associated protein n=1 Tax=Desulfonatronum thioautotrophicum TaxID=617001 RepID=UPI0005EBB26A|nr:YbaB/EbfC family nucleoid-associated protein [Desulfonatronum thioautotrophicum]TVR00853.1 MAG: YbaB/EbfC family nucleoid-associated protein [Desulfovibrionales bacterium]